MYNTPRYDSSTINSNLEKTGTYSVDITPPANFLRVIEDTGYNIAQASSDISDNSTDAGATKINLVIKSENKTPTVIIADNGTGMNSDTLCGAMVLGASNGELGSKQKGNYGDNMSGKFGTGLKTSLATFQGKSTILSKTKDGRLLKISYDNEEIINQYNESIARGDEPKWKVPLEVASDEDKLFFSEQTEGSDHGTVIKISSIKRFKVSNIQSEKQRLIREISRIFRKFILSGRVFKVNGTVLDPKDPMVYDVPLDIKGSILRSKILSEEVWDKCSYIDKDGNEKRDGWIKYTSYILPTATEKIAEDEKWNFTSSGISVLRHNREIMVSQHFGIFRRTSQLNRYRATIEFSSEMDNEWGLNYLKNKVNPNQRTLDMIKVLVKSDVRRAVRMWQSRNTTNNKLTATLNSFGNLFKNHLSRIKGMLPMLPNPSPIKKPRVTTGPKGSTGRKNKPPNLTDYIDLSYEDMGVYGKCFEGDVISNGSKKLQLVVNTSHRLYKEFLQTVSPTGEDTKMLTVAYSFMTAYLHAKHHQAPDAPEYDKYMEKFDHIEEQMGKTLSVILDGAPK